MRIEKALKTFLEVFMLFVKYFFAVSVNTLFSFAWSLYAAAWYRWISLRRFAYKHLTYLSEFNEWERGREQEREREGSERRWPSTAPTVDVAAGLVAVGLSLRLNMPPKTNEDGEREEEGERLKEGRERDRGQWLSLFRFQQYQQGALSCVLRAEHVNHHWRLLEWVAERERGAGAGKGGNN